MDYLWLLRHSVITRYRITTSSTYQVIAPADPMRYAIILDVPIEGAINYYFGDALPIMTTFVQPIGSTSLRLRYEDLGDLIRMQLMGNCSSGNAVSRITAVAFNPHRYERYMRYLDEQFSK